MFSIKFCFLFLSVLASLAVGYVIEETSANRPWSHVLDSNNKTYYVYLTPSYSYKAAKATCEKYDLRVLTIESEEESKRVTDLLLSEVGYLYKTFWTSGTRLQDDKLLDYWIWDTTQEKIKFFDWGTGEPTGENENCIQIILNEFSKGSWNSYFCKNSDLTAYVVCETY
ncbi:unnamed protein product [Phyllotreta striolata]|uniref:C-type lectin domain-containing protein n=1 Tax=Phyllotreta striolata TaxID=444603 RepID=A0A9N9U1E1_PHYSR|nr:unnamed protein product [Phyllotreta striolata]